MSLRSPASEIVGSKRKVFFDKAQILECLLPSVRQVCLLCLDFSEAHKLPLCYHCIQFEYKTHHFGWGCGNSSSNKVLDLQT